MDCERVASNACTAQTTVVGMVYVIMETAFDPGYNGTSCHIYSGCLPGNGAPIAMITVFARTDNVSVIPNGKEMLAKEQRASSAKKAVLFATVLNAVDMVYANLANVSARKAGVRRGL